MSTWALQVARHCQTKAVRCETKHSNWRRLALHCVLIHCRHSIHDLLHRIPVCCGHGCLTVVCVLWMDMNNRFLVWDDLKIRGQIMTKWRKNWSGSAVILNALAYLNKPYIMWKHLKTLSLKRWKIDNNIQLTFFLHSVIT